MSARSFTPRETVSELDRYIIGQDKAKRAVAVALRNRWRRQQVPEELRDEISPKNIIMIGATGVGKTEIARRLAKLARAPFVKVEASKFTEVGYVGRDVESMIRDLVEVGIKLVQKEALEHVRVRAEEAADDVLIDKLALQIYPQSAPSDDAPPPPPPGGFAPFGFQPKSTPSTSVLALTEEQETQLRRGLSNGEYDTFEVSLDVEDTGSPFMTVFGSQGTEEMNLKDMMSSLPGFKGKRKRRTLPVPDARELLIEQEAAKLVDSDRVQRDAIQRTEQAGIVFLDEIDKVVSGHAAKSGPDVSREGVQRDLLPIVEGSTVSTKYGPVKTDHILFVAAGAFHVSDIGDMIPELQGRFPIRVELDSLHKADFVRILTEPKNSLTKQYSALMKTEGVALSFAEDGIEAIADYAAQANERSENIGARRLHTILEALLEELSFSAPEREGETVLIDRARVEKTLEPIASDARLAKYIL